MPCHHRDNDKPETVRLGGYYLPLARSGICMTCHRPHGTAAQMMGNPDDDGPPGETRAADSALLRLDNRGVCEVCHQM